MANSSILGTEAPQASEMSDKGFDVVSAIVEKLGVDPCLLGIVLIALGCFWLINKNNKHIERMEKIRLRQWANIMRDDNGTN